MNRRRKPMAEKTSLAALEAAITAYYDNLSDAEVEEDKLWGELLAASWLLYIRQAILTSGKTGSHDPLGCAILSASQYCESYKLLGRQR